MTENPLAHRLDDRLAELDDSALAASSDVLERRHVREEGEVPEG